MRIVSQLRQIEWIDKETVFSKLNPCLLETLTAKLPDSERQQQLIQQLGEEPYSNQSAWVKITDDDIYKLFNR